MEMVEMIRDSLQWLLWPIVASLVFLLWKIMREFVRIDKEDRAFWKQYNYEQECRERSVRRDRERQMKTGPKHGRL